jgi:tripartite-type tricarboxylate transporter receptor subunit TctC
MNWYGRAFAQASLAAVVSLSASAAQAQTYPIRNITMIVPFAAGGPTDVVARIVTGQMAPGLGQSIIIENVVGAGGTTGAARAGRAANDGYTLITGHMGTHAASVPLYPKLAYHPEKDFEPVALLAGTPILILAQGLSAEGSQGVRGLRESRCGEGERRPCRHRLRVSRLVRAA